ncbi:MAG: mechanosensitive ion channel family protein [Betaproteobacteria bacterium]
MREGLALSPLNYVWFGNPLWEWGVAGLIALATLGVLFVVRRLGIRRAKAYANTTPTKIDDMIVQVSAATGLSLFLPLAFYAGSVVLELSPRFDRGLRLFATVALLLQIALWASRLIELWFASALEYRRGKDAPAATTLALLSFMSRLALWTLVLLLALNQLGFDITALLTGLGVGGIAVALAVQNILGDLFASLSIVLDKPFVVGDFIVVDELRGTVEYVGLKTTRIRSLDGELIVFSNADLLKSRIRNFKRMRERRVEFTIGATYETPAAKIAQVPALFANIIDGQPRARFDRAHFKSYGDFALIFEVVYYVLDADYKVYMDLQQAINLAIFDCFEREGIEFAYPTQTVHLHRRTPR